MVRFFKYSLQEKQTATGFFHFNVFIDDPNNPKKKKKFRNSQFMFKSIVKKLIQFIYMETKLNCNPAANCNSRVSSHLDKKGI